MQMNTLGIALITLLLAACGSSDRRDSPSLPDWVSGTSVSYPAAQYLLGRGEGNSREQATERARADLARNIEVQVSAQSRDRVSATRTSRGDEVLSAEVQQEAAQEIQTSTRQLLRGAQVSDLWRSPEGGRWHVLVTLDRPRAARDLRDEIGRLDEATRAAVSRARDSDDLLLKLAAAREAVDKQRRRVELQRVLNVVSPTGAILPPRWRLADLEAELKGLKARLRLRVEADDAELRELVAGAASTAGFLPAPGEEALYTLRVRLSTTPPEQRGGWYWQRGTLRLDPQDASGRVRGHAEWPLKVSALQVEQLRPRLLQAVDTILRKELESTLLGFAR